MTSQLYPISRRVLRAWWSETLVLDPAPPPPPTSFRIRGYLCSFPITEAPPSRENILPLSRVLVHIGFYNNNNSNNNKKKTPLFRVSCGKLPKTKGPKNNPFPEKIGTRMGAPCKFVCECVCGGGGGWNTYTTLIYYNNWFVRVMPTYFAPKKRTSAYWNGKKVL